MIRLGVNIDHVATIRNARGGLFPCPVRAAQLVKDSGADGITAHLREDRRHIKDEDIYRIKNEVDLPLNMEMAATDEMLQIALNVQPNACCIVPEKREEITTEGGLNAADNIDYLKQITDKLHSKNIRVSLFLDPEEKQIDAAKQIGADIIELHTGKYCDQFMSNIDESLELTKISQSARYIEELSMECHAGHGLNFDTTKIIANIPNIIELNIGHFIIGESIFIGLPLVIQKMHNIINSTN